MAVYVGLLDLDALAALDDAAVIGTQCDGRVLVEIDSIRRADELLAADAEQLGHRPVGVGVVVLVVLDVDVGADVVEDGLEHLVTLPAQDFGLAAGRDIKDDADVAADPAIVAHHRLAPAHQPARRLAGRQAQRVFRLEALAPLPGDLDDGLHPVPVIGVDRIAPGLVGRGA